MQGFLNQLRQGQNFGSGPWKLIIIIIIIITCMLIDVAISGDTNVIKKKPRRF